jgi:hypothetical protein
MKKCFEHSDKTRYNTQWDADTAILLIGNDELRIYHCDSCDGWHLTSKVEE